MALLPFDLLEYEAPRRLDRTLGIEPKWNAWVDIHNLISAAESTHDFGPADVQRICRKHGVKLSTAFRTERISLYAAYLDYCLDQGDLDDQHRHTLAHLARTLYLHSSDVLPTHERAFGRTVSNVLSDDCVTFEERLLLYKLQHTLGLDPALTDGTYEQMAREKLLTAVAHALCDGMLSPKERKAIEKMEAELGVDVPTNVAMLLKQTEEAWAIHHGPLPTTDVGVKLDSGEVGHFRTPCQWKRLNYARLRVQLSTHRAWLTRGDTQKLRIPSKALYGRRSEGWIAVTNRHVILIKKSRKLISYRIPSLGEVERYVNGLRLGLPDDRSLFLNAGRSNRALHSVLSRVLNPSASSHR